MMEDEDVVAGLRRITLTEPPLGFDPDDVATRAARRQRNRRSTCAAALGTAAVAAVTVTVFGQGGTPPAQPASPAPPTTIISLSALPPAGAPGEVKRVTEPIATHLDAVFPTVLPSATDLRPAQANVTADGMDSVIATKYFRAANGLFLVSLDVMGKDNPSKLPYRPGTCRPHDTCDEHPQPDGSTVVSESSSPENEVNGMRLVTHFRTDGSVVVARVTNSPDGGGHTDYPLAEQQLTALATDPGFRIVA
jgi:hypothetical protein